MSDQPEPAADEAPTEGTQPTSSWPSTSPTSRAASTARWRRCSWSSTSR